MFLTGFLAFGVHLLGALRICIIIELLLQSNSLLQGVVSKPHKRVGYGTKVNVLYKPLNP